MSGVTGPPAADGERGKGSPHEPRPDVVFNGGDLDCGSGLALLIREHMRKVPEGGVLEVRSREPTVASDLPPWCRLAGHEFLGSLPSTDGIRYFIRRGSGAVARSDHDALQRDKARAREYEWRARVRHTGPLTGTVYVRNFSFAVGQPASFEEKDAHASAVEYLLGAVGAELAVGFHGECARDGLVLDDCELTVRGSLHNVLAHLGLEEGDPSLRRLEVKCFASTPEDEGRVRTAWERTLGRAPVLSTLRKAAEVDVRLSFV
jgi:TusA-related sulfurtransferase